MDRLRERNGAKRTSNSFPSPVPVTSSSTSTPSSSYSITTRQSKKRQQAPSNPLPRKRKRISIREIIDPVEESFASNTSIESKKKLIQDQDLEEEDSNVTSSSPSLPSPKNFPSSVNSSSQQFLVNDSPVSEPSSKKLKTTLQLHEFLPQQQQQQIINPVDMYVQRHIPILDSIYKKSYDLSQEYQKLERSQIMHALANCPSQPSVHSTEVDETNPEVLPSPKTPAAQKAVSIFPFTMDQVLMGHNGLPKDLIENIEQLQSKTLIQHSISLHPFGPFEDSISQTWHQRAKYYSESMKWELSSFCYLIASMFAQDPILKVELYDDFCKLMEDRISSNPEQAKEIFSQLSAKEKEYEKYASFCIAYTIGFKQNELELNRFKELVTEYEGKMVNDTIRKFVALCYYNIGLLLREIFGDNTQSLNHYAKAIELDPFNANTYCNRGNVLSSLRNHDDALKDYNKAIELHPRKSLFYYNRGHLYRNGIKDYKAALDNYNKALELTPDDAKSLNNRANCYWFNLHQYHKALVDFNRALELKPYSSMYYANRAKMFWDLTLFPQALLDFNQALRLDPSRNDAQRGYIYLHYYSEEYLAAKHKLPPKEMPPFLAEMGLFDEMLKGNQ